MGGCGGGPANHDVKCDGGKDLNVKCWSDPVETQVRLDCVSKQACKDAMEAAKAEGIDSNNLNNSQACFDIEDSDTYNGKTLSYQPSDNCGDKTGDKLCELVGWEKESTKKCFG